MVTKTPASLLESRFSFDQQGEPLPGIYEATPMEMAAEFAAISWTQVRRRSYESWSASIEPDTNIAACSADNLYFEAMEAMSDAEVVAYVKTAIDATACGLRRAFSV